VHAVLIQIGIFVNLGATWRSRTLGFGLRVRCRLLLRLATQIDSHLDRVFLIIVIVVVNSSGGVTIVASLPIHRLVVVVVFLEIVAAQKRRIDHCNVVAIVALVVRMNRIVVVVGQNGVLDAHGTELVEVRDFALS